MRSPWISWILLMLVYLTYGRFLHAAEVEYASYIWLLSGLFAIVQAATLTILWQSSQKILLLGFQSDAGYTIMVLLLASLAVAAVVEFRLFSYLMMLVAASLLARIDTLIIALDSRFAFLVMAFFPLVGLGLSWLPVFLQDVV